MIKSSKTLLAMTIASTGLFSSLFSSQSLADLAEALKEGKAYGDLRLRYEQVSQDNALDDASALTLRTKLGYKTGSISGFNAVMEFEDNRIVNGGLSDYSVPPTGYKAGEYSVIADPESAELDQGFIQYSSDLFSAKLGRQVLTFDGHRHVGHVGWRQDKQTFDGLTAKFTPVKDLAIQYAYLNQRNRIFAEAQDLDSKDHLLNASYKTPFGKAVAYAYLLEVDNDTDNGLDTIGASFNGKYKMDSLIALYNFEYAQQSAENGDAEFDAIYMMATAGVSLPMLTAKFSYEVLGSDEGQYGFSTPLATLHKFNGWADSFLATPVEGLVDTSVTLSGKVMGAKWLISYHDYQADKASDTKDKLGSEIDLLLAKKFGNYSVGVKYADYSAEDHGVDSQKAWLWTSVSF